MGDPRIVFVSREVYPFDSAGLGNYVLFTAAALATVAEVTIITTDTHEPGYRELAAAGDPRLPDRVAFEFVAEPTLEEAGGWYSALHLWSARAFERLVALYPDGGPDLVEFPDYLGEACVSAQAVQTLDPRLRHTRVCVRAYTTAEICAVLDGYLPSDRETRHLRELERYALRHCDHFLWPGGGVLDTYRAFYGPAGVAAPVEVPHVVPVPEAPPAEPDPGSLRLLYVGRLERRKGVQNLIRAATSLPGEDWSLTLIGGDTPTAPMGVSMRAQLERMIAGDPRITLLERIPREQLDRLYRAADVCVSPSLWECWPNTVLEAFAQNRPVLATPVGGHLGLIEHEVSGWLAADQTADALADAIESLIEDPGPASAVRAAAGPRDAFERLTAAEPVRDRYLQLAGAGSRRASAADRTRPPLVSVVIPYFEMEKYVEDAVRSVAAQTYAQTEIVVVNDGSLREGDAILEELARTYALSLITQPNSGLGQARNLGVRMARGRYVLPLDPDDELLPEFLERSVEALEGNAELAYVTAWSEYVDETGRPLGGGYRPLGNAVDDLEQENLAGSAMAVIRRRVFERGFRYSPDLTSYEDWLFYRQLASAGYLGHVIPEVLLRYRVRRGSMLRAIAEPRRARLSGELRAHAREGELQWTSSSV